ncbi:ATP-dependent RecD-like DNA helicase [Paraclostridium bifermentans]
MKSKIRVNRIMYPKGLKKTIAGEFTIFTAEVVEHLEGDEPIINETYGTITLKGITPILKIGDEVTVTYGNEETNNFGTSYELKMVNRDLDMTDPKQIEAYLKLICGDAIAKELLKLENPLDIIKRQDSETLLKVKGIGQKKLDLIYRNMAENLDFSIAFAELCPLGLTQNLVVKICKAYGGQETAIEICKTNPYDLVKRVKGISFIGADEIAKKCGLDMNSLERAESIVTHILLSSGSTGKTFLTSGQFIKQINELANIDFTKIQEAVSKLEQNGTVKIIGNELCLTRYFNLEKSISEELARLATAPSNVEVPANWKAIVENLEDRQGWKHTEEQMVGIESVLFNNVVVITGKAGSGKSTITNAMCEILDDYSIAMTCLSAKASQRMTEVTKRPASTIHRLLGLGLGNEQRVMTLFEDIIIIDESSMVNGELFLMLLRAIRNGSKVVILGDDGQLQAIGDCAVFSDLLTTDKIPVIKLSKIHRQAQKSAIITKSIDIRNQIEIYPRYFEGHLVLGELKDLEIYIQQEKEGLDNVVVREFFKRLEIHQNILEVQIITAVKARGNLSTKNLNELIQKKYNKNASIAGSMSYTTKDGVTIYVGDKVINTKNNYKTRDVDLEEYPIFNGNIGIVEDIIDETIYVRFNDRIIMISNKDRDALNLAYAITVHSSQGSQWESVISAFDTSMWMLLNVEMLYTALTRASKHQTLIAEDRAIRHAIKTVEQKTKQTYLSRFLMYLNI